MNVKIFLLDYVEFAFQIASLLLFGLSLDKKTAKLPEGDQTEAHTARVPALHLFRFGSKELALVGISVRSNVFFCSKAIQHSKVDLLFVTDIILWRTSSLVPEYRVIFLAPGPSDEL